jgi:hypothetical protein
LHGRLTTHRAAESQTKGRRHLEILPVELRRNVGEPRGTCAGWRCTGLMAGRGSLKYNIRHHSRNRTMYEWSGRSCLDSLPFRRRHPVSLPEQNQTLFFFLWQLRLKQANGVGTCHMSGRLVSSALLTRFVRQQHNMISRVSEPDKKVLKSYLRRSVLLLIS